MTFADRMKFLITLLLIVSNAFCIAQKAVPEKLETTTAIYEMDPLFASKIFEKWLIDNNWDFETNPLAPRISMSGLVTALGVVVQQGESVSVNYSNGKSVLVAVLTVKNQNLFRMGYKDLMQKEVKNVSKKEFQQLETERKKAALKGGGDPFANPVSK